MNNQPDILRKIIRSKRLRVEKAKASTDLARFISLARSRRSGDSPDFRAAFSGRKKVNVIAEIKRASPSKGLLAADLDISGMARIYEASGATAISVLTEEDYFLGSNDDLAEVRKATSLPVLRKDFVFDEFQVYESAVIGADAILLIVAMLDDEKLKLLSETARQLGLDVLVEVHDECEMRRAVGIGAEMIGVNNRDLNSFEVDLETSVRLIGLAPEETVLISESGFRNRGDIARLAALGYRGFLIGEALMTAERPSEKLGELTG